MAECSNPTLYPVVLSSIDGECVFAEYDVSAGIDTTTWQHIHDVVMWCCPWLYYWDPPHSPPGGGPPAKVPPTTFIPTYSIGDTSTPSDTGALYMSNIAAIATPTFEQGIGYYDQTQQLNQLGGGATGVGNSSYWAALNPGSQPLFVVEMGNEVDPCTVPAKFTLPCSSVSGGTDDDANVMYRLGIDTSAIVAFSGTASAAIESWGTSGDSRWSIKFNSVSNNTLANLTEVNAASLSGITANQVLAFDGTEIVASTVNIPGGGGGSTDAVLRVPTEVAESTITPDDAQVALTVNRHTNGSDNIIDIKKDGTLMAYFDEGGILYTKGLNPDGGKLENLGTPTDAADGATKAYVDATTLDDLTDVDITSPAKADLLVYNAADSEWQNLKRLDGNYGIEGQGGVALTLSGDADGVENVFEVYPYNKGEASFKVGANGDLFAGGYTTLNTHNIVCNSQLAIGIEAGQTSAPFVVSDSGGDHVWYIDASANLFTSGGIDVSGNKITQVGTPTATDDAATKLYVDQSSSGVSGDYILKSGTVAFTGNQSMGSNKLTSVADPTADQDAATKVYVDINTVDVSGNYILKDGSVDFTGAQAGIAFGATEGVSGATVSGTTIKGITGEFTSTVTGVSGAGLTTLTTKAYVDTVASATSAVADIDHNSLDNLTTADPHTQYIIKTPSTTDRNLIVQGSTSRPPFAIQQAESGAADLTQWDDANTVKKAWLDKDFKFNAQELSGTSVKAVLYSGAGILDEDAMGSDSNTHLSTQQAIKAYVDSRTAGAAANYILKDGSVDFTGAQAGIAFGATEGVSGATVSGTTVEGQTVYAPSVSGDTVSATNIHAAGDLGVSGEIIVTGDITSDGYLDSDNFKTSVDTASPYAVSIRPQGLINPATLQSGRTQVGYYVGEKNTGADNTFIGSFAGYSFDPNTGQRQVMIGRSAGYAAAGDETVCIGYTAGQSLVGGYSTAIGSAAMLNATAANSLAFGNNSLREANATGGAAFGTNSGYYNTGAYLVGFGYWAGSNNTGTFVNAMGYEAGKYNTGDDIVAIGKYAASGNTGDDCVFLGYGAGKDNRTNDIFVVSSTNAQSPLLQGDFTNGDVTGTCIKDEDDMASDSPTHLATQQSIKAYVDTIKPWSHWIPIGAGTLEGVIDTGTASFPGDLAKTNLSIVNGADYDEMLILYNMSNGKDRAIAFNFIVPADFDTSLAMTVKVYCRLASTPAADEDVCLGINSRAIADNEVIYTGGSEGSIAAAAYNIENHHGGDLFIASMGTLYAGGTLGVGDFVKGAWWRETSNDFDSYPHTLQAVGVLFEGTRG